MVNSTDCNQERRRGRSVQLIELSKTKVRRVCWKNLSYTCKEGFCRPHKTVIVTLALHSLVFVRDE